MNTATAADSIMQTTGPFASVEAERHRDSLRGFTAKSREGTSEAAP